MTKKELIEKLSNFPDDIEIILVEQDENTPWLMENFDVVVEKVVRNETKVPHAADWVWHSFPTNDIGGYWKKSTKQEEVEAVLIGDNPKRWFKE